MIAIEIAATICKLFEGFKEVPYLCPSLIWTIGYGTTRYPNGKRVQPTDHPISKETAISFLYHDLKISRLSVLKNCPVLATNTNKQAAIIDFTYNLGAGRLQASTLRRRINQQDWPEAKKELLRWVRSNGKILPGLVKRRQVEATLILSDTLQN